MREADAVYISMMTTGATMLRAYGKHTREDIHSFVDIALDYVGKVESRGMGNDHDLKGETLMRKPKIPTTTGNKPRGKPGKGEAKPRKTDQVTGKKPPGSGSPVNEVKKKPKPTSKPS